MTRTLDRVVTFGFARWSRPSELDVLTEAPPLSEHHLARRVPTWTRVLREQLLTTHPKQLAERAATSVPAPPSQLSHRLSERLDRLQTRTPDAGTDIAR